MNLDKEKLKDDLCWLSLVIGIGIGGGIALSIVIDILTELNPLKLDVAIPEVAYTFILLGFIVGLLLLANLILMFEKRYMVKE